MFLQNQFDDRRIEFGMMVEECSQVRKYCEDVEKDYRQAVKALEKDGKVEVTRITSNDDGNGVQRGDLIDFRDTSGLV